MYFQFIFTSELVSTHCHLSVLGLISFISSYMLVSYLILASFLLSRLVGGRLSLSLDYCFVLEDEDGICGYALGTVDVTPFIKKCKISWIPFMQEKYTKPNGDKDLSEAEVIHRFRITHW